MAIKCLVVDDEPLACKFLEDFIEKTEILELVKSCTSALEAITILQQRRIDLLFLDIQMPEMTGIELLESINKPPNIIMTTAYDNFAVESYNFNVTDYLLKPFTFARFLKAIDKVTSNILQNRECYHTQESKEKINHLFVNNNGTIDKVDVQDIYFIKGLGDYITIRTKTKTLIMRDNLKRIEQLLSENGFIRVHKSYIVSIQKIESIKGPVITILDEKISVGPLYKNQFQQEVNRLRIG